MSATCKGADYIGLNELLNIFIGPILGKYLLPEVIQSNFKESSSARTSAKIKRDTLVRDKNQSFYETPG